MKAIRFDLIKDGKYINACTFIYEGTVDNINSIFDKFVGYSNALNFKKDVIRTNSLNIKYHLGEQNMIGTFYFIKDNIRNAIRVIFAEAYDDFGSAPYIADDGWNPTVHMISKVIEENGEPVTYNGVFVRRNESDPYVNSPEIITQWATEIGAETELLSGKFEKTGILETKKGLIRYTRGGELVLLNVKLNH